MTNDESIYTNRNCYRHIPCRTWNWLCGFSDKPISKKNSIKSTFYRGGFVDTKSLAFVLTNDAYDLDSALSDFDCPIRLIQSKKSGMSEQNLKSGLDNILAYRILYKQQMKRLENFCISKPEHRLVSPASIGKSYLEKILPNYSFLEHRSLVLFQIGR